MFRNVWSDMINIFSKDGEGIYMKYKWDYNRQRGFYEFYLRMKGQKHPDGAFVVKTKTEMESVGWGKVFKNSFIPLTQSEVLDIESTIKYKVHSPIRPEGVGFSYDELIGLMDEYIEEELADEKQRKEYFTERDNHIYITSKHLGELLKRLIEELDCEEETTPKKISDHLKECGIISPKRHQIRRNTGENGSWHYRLYLEEEE